MIRMTFTECQWGTDPLEEEGVGVQINLFDPASQILVMVPFTGNALTALITELAIPLSEEDRGRVIKAISAEKTITPDDEVEKGPQG